MNVEMCKKLLRENKFDELLGILEKEMTELYKKMLEFANFEYDEKWNFSAFSNAVTKKYPSYFNTIVMCQNALYSGEYNYGDTIDILIDSYNEMAKNYKQRIENK